MNSDRKYDPRNLYAAAAFTLGLGLIGMLSGSAALFPLSLSFLFFILGFLAWKKVESNLLRTILAGIAFLIGLNFGLIAFIAMNNVRWD